MSCAEKFILKAGPRAIWIFLVQFGEWFNIKPSRAGSLTLNHLGGIWFNIKPFTEDSLTLNHRVRAPCPLIRILLPGFN